MRKPIAVPGQNSAVCPVSNTASTPVAGDTLVEQHSLPDNDPDDGGGPEKPNILEEALAQWEKFKKLCITGGTP